MRKRHRERAVIAVGALRDLLGGICFHAVDNGKRVDNARQIERHGADRDRERNFDQLTENRAIRVGFRVQNRHIRFEMLVISANALRDDQKDHSDRHTDRNARDRIRGGNFDALSARNRVFGERDADRELPDRLRDFADRSRDHVLMPLKIPADRAGHTDEKERRRDGDDAEIRRLAPHHGGEFFGKKEHHGRADHAENEEDGKRNLEDACHSFLACRVQRRVGDHDRHRVRKPRRRNQI